MILGIDEVGRGPWAGPLVIGAVVLGDAVIEGLTDSKKLTRKQRDRLDIEIRDKVAGFGLGWVSAAEIDEIGLSKSLVLATKRAVEQIKTPYTEIIIDGTVNFLAETSKGQYVKTLPKADLLMPSVSAASIIAKVARDNYMSQQDEIYPGYNFKKHVGYGTLEHRTAIEKLGVTPLHRLSFAPLAKYRVNTAVSAFDENGFAPGKTRASAPCFVLAADVFSQKGVAIADTAVPTTKQIGDSGEDAAANFLTRNGHKILERNWKTKYCEIDIVSLKHDVLFFTEVKYRKKHDQGGGLAAIDKKKLNQMKFAANFYVQSNKIEKYDMRLAAISVGSDLVAVEEFLEIL